MGRISRVSARVEAQRAQRRCGQRVGRAELGTQHAEQRLRQREDRHRQQHEVDAVEELHGAEGEARHVGRDVLADRREHEPEHDHHHALDELAARGERGDRGEREHRDREVVGRVEGERHLRERRRRQQQEHRGDGAAGERAVGRDRERLARLALPRQRVAVECGRDRARLAGRVDQDRRGRAAEDGAVVDAGHQDQRGGGVELVGERDHERDRGDRPEARDHADHGADRGSRRGPSPG